MAIKVDTAKWTGLDPRNAPGDVRDAQNPRAGTPIALPKKTYARRLLNWVDVATIMVMALLASAFIGLSLHELFVLAFTILAVFALIAGIRFLLNKLSGDRPAIILDEHGFHLPLQFRDPVPWPKVGTVQYTYSRQFRWISVLIDKDHQMVQNLPWPFSRLSEGRRSATYPIQILSCWVIKADPEELIDTIERYRDNYCAPPEG